ncbi:unnamed protein product [Aphanomyces euteiches]|nr:hypothetical protein Ae201684P_017242 [Aphanomyces euteiches]
MTDGDVVERLLFGRDFEDSCVAPVVYDESDAALWLEDSMSADDSPTQSQTKRKRRQRLTVKQEIEYLRDKQRELRGQLDQLEVKSQLKGPATVWENRVKNQMAAAQRAMQENAE